MKIKATFNKNQISDELSINGNELTVNGNPYDLDNVQERPEAPETLVEGELEIRVTRDMVEERQAEIQQFYIDNPVYLENEKPVIELHVAMNRNFLFMNNNHLTFHDKDFNNDFNLEELTDFIRCYNLENSVRIEEHRQVITEFCLQYVSEKNQGKARAFYNSRTPGTLRANYTRTLNQFIADNKLTDVFKAEVMTGYEAWLQHVKDCMEVK